MDRRLDTERPFRGNRPLFVLSSRFQSRSAQLSSVHRAAYSCAMNPLPNEWEINHRAISAAVTRGRFVSGNYFSTLLFQDAEGYRREDLSEQAWQTRNENIRPFSFWKSRFEPVPAKPAEPVPREN